MVFPGVDVCATRVSSGERRHQRQDEGVQLRKNKRNQQVQKRRNMVPQAGGPLSPGLPGMAGMQSPGSMHVGGAGLSPPMMPVPLNVNEPSGVVDPEVCVCMCVTHVCASVYVFALVMCVRLCVRVLTTLFLCPLCASRCLYMFLWHRLRCCCSDTTRV